MSDKSSHAPTPVGTFTSDLACERRRVDLNTPGVEFKREESSGYVWERINITTKEGEESIGRPIGTYDTLTLPRMDKLIDEDIYDAAEEVARELCEICDKNLILPARILVVGLGNPNLTSDSIGPKSANLINATMHIRNFNKDLFEGLECSEIAVCSPGVSANSGMEASDIVMGLCEKIHPDVVFAIDALAAREASRLGKTIQFSDTGIFPGSGIGNTRAPLNKATLGAPVISLGVPTVISAEVFLIGDEEDERRRQRIKYLNRNTEGMFVSPKEIDGIVDASAKIIARGINQAFGIA